MVDVSAFTTGDWKRLGRAIRGRRVALKLSQTQLAHAAGVGVNTVSNIEKGGGPRRELTLGAVEEALGWEAGSWLRVLEGEAPVIAEVEEPKDDGTLTFERPPGLSDEAWAEITEAVVADLERYLRWRRG